MKDNNKQVSPLDPGPISHAFGVGLAQIMRDYQQPQVQQPPQAQTQRAREVKREIHVISDTEYILTETTREIESFSFPTDVFNIFRGEGR